MSISTLLSNKAVILGSIALLAIAYGAQGALEGIVFPVAELGDCASREACKAYCNVPDHMIACTQFAQKNKLVSSEQVRRVEKLVSILKTGGPGSCRTPETCKAYCDEPEHRTECASYAERNGLVPSPSPSPSPSASPRITPRPTERPRLPAPSVMAPKLEPRIEEPRLEIPKEFLNGGATNLPPLPDQRDLKPTSRGIGSSLLGLFVRILFGGMGQ